MNAHAHQRSAWIFSAAQRRTAPYPAWRQASHQLMRDRTQTTSQRARQTEEPPSVTSLQAQRLRHGRHVRLLPGMVERRHHPELLRVLAAASEPAHSDECCCGREDMMSRRRTGRAAAEARSVCGGACSCSLTQQQLQRVSSSAALTRPVQFCRTPQTEHVTLRDQRI